MNSSPRFCPNPKPHDTKRVHGRRTGDRRLPRDRALGGARACASAGYHVVAVARSQKALEGLDDEIRKDGGEGASLVPMDLKDYEAIDRLGGVIYERWGKLDALFANAAILGDLT